MIEKFGFHEDIIRIHPDNGGTRSKYGATILGSYIGTDEFITSEIQKSHDSLTSEATAIKGVEDTQIQYLLLRWCFSQKITHLLRTLPLHLCNELITHFSTLKREILSNIVGSPLDDITWNIAQLPVSESGLGLLDPLKAAPCAYAASFSESYTALVTLQSEFFGNIHLPCYENFISSVESISMVDPTITTESIFTIVREKQIKHIQHHLFEIFTKNSASELINSLSSNRAKIWHHGLQNSVGGLWLDSAPKTDMHKMSPAVFCKAIRLRLFMPMNESLNGLKCPCGNGRKNNRKVDPQGLHFITGCNLKGVRHFIHDSLTQQISTIMKTCGIHTSLEGVGIFGVNNNLRPDITARNYPKATQPVAFDVRVTSAVPANTLEVTNQLGNDPQTPQRALQANWNQKMAKYSQLARANNIGFKPIIFDITGRMHPDTEAILKQCIEEAARLKNIPFSRLWHYWISSLQITLQRSVICGMETLRTHALQQGTHVRRYVSVDHIMNRVPYMGA